MITQNKQNITTNKNTKGATKMNTALCDKVNDETTGTATQIVEIIYNNTTVEYTITRELDEGGNISEVEKHFQNLPYIEGGQKKYDADLSILDDVFTAYNNTYMDLDQLLWDMNINETTTTNIIMDYEDAEKEIELTIKLVENIIE